MNQLIVRLPEEQKALLESLATQRRTTVSSLARTAIKNFLSKKASSSLFTQLAKIGKRAKLNHPPQDLSVNYKKYLY